jgi:hypothetical protein
MLEFEVAPGDQSVYEITTTSGKKYLVRCPGTESWETKGDKLLVFLIGKVSEQPAMLRELDKIVSITKREDLVSNDPRRPERMSHLFWAPAPSIASVHLE